MADFTNGELAQKLSDLIAYWSTFGTEYSNWLGGEVDGGESSDGKYPLTDYADNEILVECPAKLADDVSGYVGDASGYADAAAASAADAATSETNADDAAATATAQAVLADADRVSAETAESSAINEAVTAVAQAAAAVVSAAAAAADAVLTAADLVLTNADVVSTGDDVVATAADAVATAADAVATAADAVATGDDAIATAADAVSTGDDAIATAADAVSTGDDAIATAADAVSTGDDAIATAADAVQTGSDATDTAADAADASDDADDAATSAAAAAASAAEIDYTWGSITSKPTTIAGYSISDAYDKTEIDNTFANYTLTSGLSIANWNTAYGWGDHSATYEPLDATLVRSDDAAYNATEWDTAHGWGDHSGTYEPLDATLVRNDDAAYNATEWDTAYGWGDHSGAYLPLAGGTLTGNLTATGFRLGAGGQYAVKFWGGNINYRICMAAQGDATYGGRIDTTSDYNMMFSMQGGTNRGFVFQNDLTEVFGISPDGIYTNQPLYFGGDKTSYITQNDNIRLGTDHGYIDIGPLNTSWCHFNTDRAGTYWYDPMYCASTLRVDGAMDVNGNIVCDGATVISAVETIQIDATGDITKTSHGNYLYHASASYDNDQNGQITFGTGAASGGTTGDIHFQYTA